MTKNEERIDKALMLLILLMAVLCIGLVLHDSVISKENYKYFEEVASSKAAGIYLVNINTADKDELKDLPGVGDVIAERIIDYREKNGGFESAKDLMNVEGIGEKTFDSLSDLITY